MGLVGDAARGTKVDPAGHGFPRGVVQDNGPDPYEPLSSIQGTTKDATANKPQSKLWHRDDTWFAALAGERGIWVSRLEQDLSWTPVLRISDESTPMADCKAVGDATHILLHDESPELVSIEYVPESRSYQPWSERRAATPIGLKGSETATIDVNSVGRMWLATERKLSIHVYHAAPPYLSFEGPITLDDGVTEDDIGAVVALRNGSVGVFWSNIARKAFGFRTHTDGEDPARWSADELPPKNARVYGDDGVANDHMNLAVAADGTLYCAIKTGYRSETLPHIAMLVRRPDGTWEDLIAIDTKGTRPIVLVNDDRALVRILYTSSPGFSPIAYRDASMSELEFGPMQSITGTSHNNCSSTKEAWSGGLVVLFSREQETDGVRLRTDR